MKRMIGCLKSLLTRQADTAVGDRADDPATVKRGDHAIDVPSREHVARWMDDKKSAQTVTTPDSYSDEHVATVPDLRILEPTSPDTDECRGFNPYDTGVLRKK